MTAVQYQLAELATIVAAQFKAHGVPCWVKFGDKRYGSGLVTENELVIREEPEGDSFEDAPRAGGTNPQPIALRTCGALADLMGRSTSGGADVAQHRAVTVALLHQLVAALIYAGHQLGSPVELGRGGFIVDENQPSEYGARYALAFTVPEVICSATQWATSLPDTGFQVGVYQVIGTTETLACSHEEPPPED